MEFIDTLPYKNFRKVVERYSKNAGSDFKNDIEIIHTLDFKKRLQKIGVNSYCPKYHSKHFKK